MLRGEGCGLIQIVGNFEADRPEEAKTTYFPHPTCEVRILLPNGLAMGKRKVGGK